MVAKDWWLSINDKMIVENVSYMKASNIWCYLSYGKVAREYPDLIKQDSDEPLIVKIGVPNRVTQIKELGKYAKATVVRYGQKITSKDFEDFTTACRYALNQSGRSNNANVIYRVTYDEDTRVVRDEWESNEYFNGSYMGTKKYSHKRC